MSSPPQYILVENVVGFERSDTRATLIATLQAQKYHHQEFVLSPQALGVPYSRPRYFCLARTRPLPAAVRTGELCRETPRALLARLQGAAQVRCGCCCRSQAPPF